MSALVLAYDVQIKDILLSCIFLVICKKGVLLEDLGTLIRSFTVAARRYLIWMQS